MIILIENKPYVTDFDSQISLSDFRVNEQHYSRTTKLWYHASNLKIDHFFPKAPNNAQLTHFASKHEFSVDFYRTYRGRKDRFGYLYYCRLTKTVDLINFQSTQDYNKITLAFPLLKDYIDINLMNGNGNPRYFKYMANPSILAAAKQLNYDGVATFGDNPGKVKGFRGSESIGLFDATVMRIADIRLIDLGTNKISKNTFLFAPEGQEPEF